MRSGERQVDLRGLDEACARIGCLFARSESRARAADYVEGLLSRIGRKNSWQVAAHAGHASPDGIQWLLTRAPWSADALRDITRDYVVEHLGDARSVAVFDDVAFGKRGDKSVGVARQRVGPDRRMENCQVGVFMAYASPKGVALVDRALYLPKLEWAEDMARRKAAGVPEQIRYTTKPQMANRMLARALAARVPIAAVVVGQSCAGPSLRDYCVTRRITLVEEVSPRHLVDTRGDRPVEAAALARLIPSPAFERGYPGGGSAAMVRLGSAGVERLQTSLLVRSRATSLTGHLYFLCHAPQWVSLNKLVAAADTLTMSRQYIDHSRVEAGLDQYEVRKWEPWYRHISLSMFAMAYLAENRLTNAATANLERLDFGSRTQIDRAVGSRWRSPGNAPHSGAYGCRAFVPRRQFPHGHHAGPDHRGVG